MSALPRRMLTLDAWEFKRHLGTQDSDGVGVRSRFLDTTIHSAPF
jgi:hypothetical protein